MFDTWAQVRVNLGEGGELSPRWSGIFDIIIQLLPINGMFDIQFGGYSAIGGSRRGRIYDFDILYLFDVYYTSRPVGCQVNFNHRYLRHKFALIDTDWVKRSQPRSCTKLHEGKSHRDIKEKSNRER